MPYDIHILLLPLVGGYFILDRNILFLHQYKHMGSQRLLFESIIAGFILFSITYFLRFSVSKIFPNSFEFCYNLIQSFLHPHKITLIGTSGVSFVLALLFTSITNKLYEKIFIVAGNKKYIKDIRRYGDELENIFVESMLEGKFVLISLKNNKVYVGLITEISGPIKKTNYITLLPIVSGYRKSKNKSVVFTTPYEKVVNTITENERSELIKDMKIIIKQDEILTANFFYPEVYDKFQEHIEETEK